MGQRERDAYYKALSEQRWQYAVKQFGGLPGDKLRTDYFGKRR